jgi:hypothetical protein
VRKASEENRGVNILLIVGPKCSKKPNIRVFFGSARLCRQLLDSFYERSLHFAVLLFLKSQEVNKKLFLASVRLILVELEETIFFGGQSGHIDVFLFLGKPEMDKSFF